MFPNPDFELYDNVGRTTEQIHAYNTNQPTEDDRRRWAARDLITSGTVPPAGDSIVAWVDQLARTDSVDDFRDLLIHVLDADDGALPRLHHLLESAADWCERRGFHDAAPELFHACERLDDIGGELQVIDGDLPLSPASPDQRRASTATARSTTGTNDVTSGADHTPSAAESPPPPGIDPPDTAPRR